MSGASDSHETPGEGDASARPAGDAPQGAALTAEPPHADVRRPSDRRAGSAVAGLVALLAVGYLLAPAVVRAFRTVSTDDAYINGHVTFVAPRVSGQVSRVLVDDNQRVSKGDLLVELDREPYEVQVAIRKSDVATAEADLKAAESEVRANLGRLRGLRWKLQTEMEQVDNYVALLRSRVATLHSREATRDRAKADYERASALYTRNAISREELDQRREADRVGEANVHEALEQVSEARVSLGLSPLAEQGGKLEDVPADLNQSFSGVRQALAELAQSAAQVGLPLVSSTLTPKAAIEDFIRRDKEGNIDRILEQIVPESPAVRQAQAKLMRAHRDLAQSELDLRYCDVVSEIDGVVTRRNVNPGNNVSAGQSLMAVRSQTEIWVDANFKETQLADLRIGQRVQCRIDMYGSKLELEGRITGFTMGTGQTLALLPPQNATGNYVKVVQRLPVRIEFTDYDPSKTPLFVGLSVVPYVYYREPAAGPHAGEVLQPALTLPKRPTPSDRPAVQPPDGNRTNPTAP